VPIFRRNPIKKRCRPLPQRDHGSVPCGLAYPERRALLTLLSLGVIARETGRPSTHNSSNWADQPTKLRNWRPWCPARLDMTAKEKGRSTAPQRRFAVSAKPGAL
jgi:hypothetical protein